MSAMKHILFIGGIFFMFTSCRQENMLFFPVTLPADHIFTFNNAFQEYFFKVDEKTQLNGLLFRADSSKGLVFYLHGNSGCIDSWGHIADVYLENNYDLFVLDYRGYGKSQGSISSEKQLHSDVQIVYDSLKKMYDEKDIVIIGNSIGTGLATKLASTNSPKRLILNAPYYSMIDLAHQYIKFMPSFIIRYKLKTNEYITQVKCPVTIFHGDQDEVIYVGSSEKLKKLFKEGDQLFILEGQQHNGINENVKYQTELRKLLN